MTISTTFVKVSTNEVVVKVAGGEGSTVIRLNDLVAPYETIFSQPVVDIAGYVFTGTADSVASIERDTDRILTISGAYQMLFTGQDMLPDSTSNTHDIKIDMVGTQGQLHLKLKKVVGYAVPEFNDYTRYDAGMYWDNIVALWE